MHDVFFNAEEHICLIFWTHLNLNFALCVPVLVEANINTHQEAAIEWG